MSKKKFTNELERMHCVNEAGNNEPVIRNRCFLYKKPKHIARSCKNAMRAELSNSKRENRLEGGLF